VIAFLAIALLWRNRREAGPALSAPARTAVLR
jgi:hypothetical protein